MLAASYMLMTLYSYLYVRSLKYLGVHLVAGKCFSCCVKSVRMKFYRTFNGGAENAGVENAGAITIESCQKRKLKYTNSVS